MDGRGDEAPQSFRVEPNVFITGSIAPPTAVAAVSAGEQEAEVKKKKKRGRPKKYGPDGKVTALSPMPISASIPLTGVDKPVQSIKKKHKLDHESSGGTMGNSQAGSFLPHMITVNPGEDVSNKIISFSQQGSRAICILAANGAISNVTFRQNNSSGGTLTYEGRFEILSLTGLFLPSDNGLAKSRSGGMSVTLSGSDGRVLGGGLAGMLVAASSVQVVIGSFIPGQDEEQKAKKQKYHDNTITFGSKPVSEERCEAAAAYDGSKPNLNTSISFKGDNLGFQGNRMTSFESNVSMSRENSREQSHEITC